MSRIGVWEGQEDHLYLVLRIVGQEHTEQKTVRMGVGVCLLSTHGHRPGLRPPWAE